LASNLRNPKAQGKASVAAARTLAKKRRIQKRRVATAAKYAP